MLHKGGQAHRAAAPLPPATGGIAAPAGQGGAYQATAGQAELVVVVGLAEAGGVLEGGAVVEGPLQQLLRADCLHGINPGLGVGLKGGWGAGARVRADLDPGANRGPGWGAGQGGGSGVGAGAEVEAGGGGELGQGPLQPCR